MQYLTFYISISFNYKLISVERIGEIIKKYINKKVVLVNLPVKYLYRLKIVLAFSLLSTLLLSQNRPGQKWKEIKTQHYNIIVTDSQRTQGFRIANRLEHLYPRSHYELGYKHDKLSLVLNPEQARGNGFVQLPPYHSEWSTTPHLGRFTGTTNWFDLLSFHEIRHAVQYSYLNTGTAKFMRTLFGQSGQAVAINLLIPQWYFEGDAIYQETLLSNSGRGRTPYFNKHLRALLINDIQFNYPKTIYGSYKNKVPSHYQYGYYQTAYFSNIYGRRSWSLILDRTMEYPMKISIPYLLHPFSNSLKKHIGVGARTLYKKSMQDIKRKWEKNVEDRVLTDFNNLTHFERQGKTDYLFPKIGADNNLYCVKSGLSYRPTLTQIQDNQETSIHPLPAECSRTNIDLKKNKLVWSEVHSHKRWDKVSWSDIVKYDLKSGSRKQLTQKKRYYHPSISPSGKKIAILSFNKSRRSQIVLLNSKNGAILQKFKLSKYETPLTPSWSPDGCSITFVSKNKNKKNIKILNIDTGKQKRVLATNTHNFYNPIFWQNYIIFESTYDGIGDLYALNLNTDQIKRITSSKIGAYNPEIDRSNNILYYNHYNYQGQNIATTKLTPSEWKMINPDEKIAPYITDNDKELRPLNDSVASKIDLSTQDYKGANRYINIHSWTPTIGSSYGIHLYSTNILNTVDFGIGGYWNINEAAPYFSSSLTFKKYYPITSISGNLGLRKNYYINDFQLDSVSLWNERKLSVDQKIPLIKNKSGITLSQFSLNYGASYLNMYNNRNKIYREDDTTTHYLNHKDKNVYYISLGSEWKIQNENSKRDLVQDGLLTRVRFQKTLPPSTNNSTQFYLGTQIGIRTPQNDGGFKLNLQYERNLAAGYQFQHFIEKPFGIGAFSFKNGLKGKLEYNFPLLYPDLNLLGLTYLKRIFSVPFIEYFRSERETLTNLGKGVTFEFGGIFGLKVPLFLSTYGYINTSGNNRGIAIRFKIGQF